MTSPTIQYDIINDIATKTTNAIIREVEDGLFAILVYEACDISMKEQMVVALRLLLLPYHLIQLSVCPIHP